ncbi:hypothetical protein NVV94_00195 [Pseudomonas sp. LS1212]|uniref:PA0061/PA0062 family lipoprotein n=1 Tax=Pseudomonas sp. LS1212 TaxID=2972478 RepID=UPI00215CA19C|nr:hypothetical protein [Pseudomonas sp. LS1212]UVJ44086.1 hypothetical protein NVV94_00195 [Pseudomonas sp. LS1212]
MRQPLIMLTLSTLGACASPLPPVDPQQAWVDMFTITGKLVMADRLDGKRLNDGRYFQVPPGQHELIVRFDFEVPSGAFNTDPVERTCYLTVRYDSFQAGQRYRLEARAIAMQPNAWLYDSERRVVAEERNVRCLI